MVVVRLPPPRLLLVTDTPTVVGQLPPPLPRRVEVRPLLPPPLVEVPLLLLPPLVVDRLLPPLLLVEVRLLPPLPRAVPPDSVTTTATVATVAGRPY